MIAEQILFSQGFGTRHECTGLIVQGRFRVNGTAVTDPDEDIPTEDLTFEVDGVQWPFFEKAIILLNKPEHYECSLKPIHHPSVLAAASAFARQKSPAGGPSRRRHHGTAFIDG